MTEYWFAAVREPPTLRNMLLDDDDTGEAERDIDGRKQIETDNNRDGLYTIGLFANSLFLRFAVDGGQAIVQPIFHGNLFRMAAVYNDLSMS
jgi:hypothetical protein